MGDFFTAQPSITLRLSLPPLPPSAHNPALACTSSHILSTTIYGGAFCFPGRIDCIPSFGGAATHGGLVVMLLPKGGVTWKSAKAQLPPTRAIWVFLTRTRFLLCVALENHFMVSSEKDPPFHKLWLM